MLPCPDSLIFSLGVSQATLARGVRARPESGALQGLVTVVPDFWGCWLAHSATIADFNSHCLGTNNPEAEIISSGYCEPEVKQDWGRIAGTDPTQWEWINASFSGGDIYPAGLFLLTAMGEITNPRVGNAQCWSPGPSSGSGDTKETRLQCTGIGPTGVFRNTNEAVAWLEGDCTPQGCNRTISYRWDYDVPFGRCEKTAGLGVLNFSDYYEEVLAGFFLADEDLDGILDLDDDCRSEPEDFDNYLDSDGCPEQAPQPPACFVMPGETLCGTGAAPTGFVVTDLTYLPNCCGVNGGGCNNQGVNARRVTPYTGIPSGFGCELRICTGYDAPPPPAWSVVNSSVPTLACQGTQLVARKQ